MKPRFVRIENVNKVIVIGKSIATELDRIYILVKKCGRIQNVARKV